MSFEVVFSPKSAKQIRSLDEGIRERVRQAVIEIGSDPRHRGTIKVKGYENIRRKRAGNYRILYTIDKQRNEVLVVKIEKRSETTYK
jgi:mRNA interferase RelE/StbE